MQGLKTLILGLFLKKESKDSCLAGPGIRPRDKSQHIHAREAPG
jgi:hypothetical protein